MARSSRKELSHKEVSKRLQEVASTTMASEFVFDLLRIFAQTTDTMIARIREGKKPAVREEGMILVEKLIAYKSSTAERLFDDLEALKANDKVRKKAARLLVVSDGHKIIGFDPKEEEAYENEIALLWKDYDFFMPLAGIEKFRNIEENEADVKASYLMAKIYDDIRRYNDLVSDEQIHSLNVFLTRLLFCFFAEDTGIFDEKLFTGSVSNYTKIDGSDLKEYIEGAFDIMSIESAVVRDNMPKYIRQFPYVNGGLFREHYPVPNLSRRTRDLLLKCGSYQWQNINPDIFGSMIQAVIRPEDRAGLGLHYTSVPNILKVIRPLFLDALYEDFAGCKDDERKLRQMLVRLSKIKFFDPACGSGNFLIIAYKELRKLESQIWTQITALNEGQGVLPFSSIALTQFYGIEIDEFAQETATLSLWLAEHQENKKFYDKFGTSPDVLPLRASGYIVHGNACRIDWNDVCPHTIEEEVYVMGNPPYLGSSLQNKIQKQDKDVVLNGLKSYKDLDYIACWFYYGAKFIVNSRAKCAFVSTNSICQGEQVAMLWGPIFKMNVEIGFAHTSFLWSNNAKYKAAVFCIIVGLRNKSIEPKYILSDNSSRVVHSINGYLIDGNTPYMEKRGKAISEIPQMLSGNKASDGGFLILNESEMQSMITDYPESDAYIREQLGSVEFINGGKRWCLYIQDFDLINATKIEPIKQRLENVSIFRSKSSEKSTRLMAKSPHKYYYDSHQCEGKIIIPATSSIRRQYIPMGLLENDIVVSNSAFVINGGGVFALGVIMSEMHMCWVKAVGGRMKNDYRYSTALCYNTFPLPKITTEQRKELEEYAEEVLLTREGHSEMTLAEMYDPDGMPQDLREAHRALDLAVERCYRPEPFRSDTERLEHLFKLYEKMTKK